LPLLLLLNSKGGRAMLEMKAELEVNIFADVCEPELELTFTVPGRLLSGWGVFKDRII
jgi:hypothetical protein